jgi:DNA modification methylase
VADRLQRDCVGIELNPEYADMAFKRIRAESPLFVDIKIEAQIPTHPIFGSVGASAFDPHHEAE